jgi:hypothetical protein
LPLCLEDLRLFLFVVSVLSFAVQLVVVFAFFDVAILVVLAILDVAVDGVLVFSDVLPHQGRRPPRRARHRHRHMRLRVWKEGQGKLR